MADYYSIITNRGKELEAEALASGRLIVLTHFVVGDSNGKQVKPDPAQIRLINETFRGDIAELVVSPEQSTQLMAKIVLPIGVGGFTVREVGLMTDAGELYAVANCPSIDKPVGGVSVNMQFRLAVSDTSNITLNVATGDGLFLRIDQNLKEIKARGAEAQKTSRESIGVLDGTTQQRGLVQLNSALNSTSETQAATPAAVKIVMDNANARLAKDRNGADIPNVALFLQNLGFPELGIAGTGTILPSLDWQQFNFVPGARYFIKSSDMSNVPAQIVITQPTFNAVMDVIGYDGITRHVDIWFSSTPDEYFSRYQVMIAGHQGSRTFSVRRIWTSSEPVPLSGGGTGADNVSSALNNFGIGPIANASEVTAGTSKKLIDAALLKAFLPQRSFQANDVIRIPDQPGGLMVQFGTLTGVSGSDVISSTLTFPELFPNACLAVIPVAVSSDTGGGMVGVQVKTPTRSNADIFIYERNGGAIAAHSVQYIAIGW